MQLNCAGWHLNLLRIFREHVIDELLDCGKVLSQVGIDLVQVELCWMSFVFFLLEILAIKEAMKFNVWIAHGYCPLLTSDKFGPIRRKQGCR